MKRKNIFELLAENINIKTDYERILDLYQKRQVVTYGLLSYTLHDFVDEYCFASWKNRGRCVDLQDFLHTIRFDNMCWNIRQRNTPSLDSYILFTETIYNFWMLAHNYITAHGMLYLDKVNNDFGTTISYEFSCTELFFFLKTVILDSLSQLNYTVYYDEDKEQALVVENKSEVTSVAEIVDDSLSLDVIRYNHFRLKGDLKAKKLILHTMGLDLEGKRPKLKEINSRVQNNLFGLINKLNIRHGDDENKKITNELSVEELEKWYDELYQMMLYAYLDIDSINRNKKAELFLKEKRGGKANGQTPHGNPGPDSPEH